MRTEGQTKHKLKQVLFRHLQKRLRLSFRRRPETCFHNRTLEGEGGLQVGICGFPKGKSCLCDCRLPEGLDRARDCLWWEPRRGKEEVKAEFRDLVESPDRGAIAAEYPDVAALLWVLGDANMKDTVQEAVSDIDKLTDEELWGDKA